MKGENSRQTGDVNLAASLMACGISLSASNPVKIIESWRGSYGAWMLDPYSADGKNITEKLMLFWVSGEGIDKSHPFSQISKFIRSRPDGVSNSDEWLAWAVDYLCDNGIVIPGLARVSDIERFVAALPAALESYILAFVHNRDVCLQLYRKAKRSIHMSRNDSHTMIDVSLPKWQRLELLSRLEG